MGNEIGKARSVWMPARVIRVLILAKFGQFRAADRSVLLRVVVLALLLLPGHPAIAEWPDPECRSLHELVDRAFDDFRGMVGKAIQRDAAGSIHELTKPAKPFEKCHIYVFANNTTGGPLLKCDLTAQAGINSIEGAQTEISSAILMKTVQSIADDYSQCFVLRVDRKKGLAAQEEGREKFSWLWPLKLWSRPTDGVMVVLELEQAKAGQHVSRSNQPAITIDFARVAKQNAQ